MGAKKFTCPVCGTEVRATSENMREIFSTKKIKALLCPMASNYNNTWLQHLVAIKYYNEWRTPESFMYDPSKDGLLPAEPGTEDEVVIYLLWREALKDGHTEFRTPTLTKERKAKILWIKGRPVGYYLEAEYRGKPTLSQIYILPEHRRKGYGTMMVEDFLKSHPEGKVKIESPNKDFLMLLTKMGLVEWEGDKYKPKGRIEIEYLF